jgi:hypothetical protein
VHNQRSNKALTEDRIEMLKELDFPWTVHGGISEAKSSKKAHSAPRPLGTKISNHRVSPPKSSDSKLKVLKLKTTGLPSFSSSQVVGRKRKEGPAVDVSHAAPPPPAKRKKTARGKASRSRKSSSRRVERSSKGSDPVPDAAPSSGAGTMALASGREKRYATYESIWVSKYQALQRFKSVYGHTQVPSTYPSDQPLSNWIRNQRSAHNRGELKKDRVDRLNELDPRWRNGWLVGPADGSGRKADQGSGRRGKATASLKDDGSGDVAESPDVALSSMTVTVPETSAVLDASCAEYKKNASDPAKLVVASIAWSPAPDAYRDL